jgi:hypothetical protein
MISQFHSLFKPSFAIHFYFTPNEFFEDTVLTKTYIAKEEEKVKDTVLDKIEG